MFRRSLLAFCFIALVLVSSRATSKELPTEAVFTNSIGMKLVRIEAGSFDMGFEGVPLGEEVLRYRENDRIKAFLASGNPDEHPRHRVTVTRPFYLGSHEVTNRQYEAFDPGHAKFRGWRDRSTGDDDAVIMVSWEEARAFCRWLSEKERRTYRLPTEAEWEYACRAGTDTPYYTGENLPPGKAPPNAWGLHDMHGNVEEWCDDWYGPYPAGVQIDPTGRASGQFKVTRGGSYGTDDFYLRSANRGGTITDDRSWILGFRVVLGEPPGRPPLAATIEAYQRDVSQTTPADVARGPDPASPYFDVRAYVKIPEGQSGPLYYHHNHNPDIVECPNGDLLAAWFSTESEGDREMVYGAARLRHGESAWEPASVFWAPPDRKAEYVALWVDGDRIHHFSSLGAFRSRPSAVVLRTSTDNGASWSSPRTIAPRRDDQGVMESVIRMSYGTIVVPLDDHNVLVSYDDAATWSSPVRGDMKKNGVFGIHTPVVELRNGDLMTLGRNDNIDGRMPKSISSDVGQNWTHSASVFPPVGGGQRSTMLRLQEGPIFFASFAKEMEMLDANRETAVCSGLFGALSFDDGRTWPIIQLISDGSGREVFSRKNEYFKMTATRSEKNGYLAACQSRDGVIHLVSNRSEYAFNLKWLWSGFEPDVGGGHTGSGPWDLEDLFRTPDFEWVDDGSPVRSLYYGGEPYRKRGTRVFALYATPGSIAGDPSRDRDLPAVVLVHGGGGTAFKEWVELWARRGYAALAMDLGGRGPDRKAMAEGGPAQSNSEKFGAIALPVTEQWTYHAVANVIRAHSLVRSFSEVDRDRTALTGISWGGYLTCIVAGLDSRFKAAVPVYGCGFLTEGSAWSEPFAAMGGAVAAKWTHLWDPSTYVGRARMPVFFVNGTNDFAYWMPSYKKTYDLVRAPGRNLRITVRMPHGHSAGWEPQEIGLFIDEHLRGSAPLAKISSPRVRGDKVDAPVASELPLREAQVHFAKTAKLTPQTEWGSLPARLADGRIKVARPAGATALFLTVTDERGAVVSSELVFVPGGVPTPTRAEVPYGPHARNVLDFWEAEGDGPRPLLVHIHGGGWTQGEKKRSARDVRPFLEKGISYAAINYRLTPQDPLPAPVHDAARAIQFLRSKATEWNIRKDRIALTGGSAGACTSMWILLHDDLADPEADDPVRRESTRVCGAAARAGQTSIDPKVIEEWVGPNILQHRMINLAVDEKTIDAALANYEKHRAHYIEFSPYNHLDGDDPPLFMYYGNNMELPSQSAGHGIHHPVLGVKMKEKADRLGHECHLLIPEVSHPEKYADANAFLMEKLLER